MPGKSVLAQPPRSSAASSVAVIRRDRFCSLSIMRFRRSVTLACLDSCAHGAGAADKCFGDNALESGTLFVVATPIGNRDDLSPRARQILREVDLIAAEDTRHTGRLLSHFGIKTPQMALHEHNEERRVGELSRGWRRAPRCAGQRRRHAADQRPRVSPAGCRARGRRSPYPRCRAPAPFVRAVRGRPAHRPFLFRGLPARQNQGTPAVLAALAAEPRTLVFLESVHKVAAALPDLVAAFGRRAAWRLLVVK